MQITQLLDKRAAAPRLAVSVRMLDKLIAQRRISIVKIGRRVLFREVDLEKFINTNLVREVA